MQNPCKVAAVEPVKIASEVSTTMNGCLGSGLIDDLLRHRSGMFQNCVLNTVSNLSCHYWEVNVFEFLVERFTLLLLHKLNVSFTINSDQASNLSPVIVVHEQVK